jgi:hypothetical protein
MIESEAREKGNALLARMNGVGWKLRVWNNAGWHYAVRKGPMEVFPSTIAGHFRCLLSDTDKAGHGYPAWTTDYAHEDPNEVVQHEVENARRVFDGIMDHLSVAVLRAEELL